MRQGVLKRSSSDMEVMEAMQQLTSEGAMSHKWSGYPSNRLCLKSNAWKGRGQKWRGKGPKQWCSNSFRCWIVGVSISKCLQASDSRTIMKPPMIGLYWWKFSMVMSSGRRTRTSFRRFQLKCQIKMAISKLERIRFNGLEFQPIFQSLKILDNDPSIHPWKFSSSSFSETLETCRSGLESVAKVKLNSTTCLCKSYHHEHFTSKPLACQPACFA